MRALGPAGGKLWFPGICPASCGCGQGGSGDSHTCQRGRIMKDMEEISEEGDRGGQQRKKALPQRRRTRHKIKWPQFS